jgi:hypothetical protein
MGLALYDPVHGAGAECDAILLPFSVYRPKDGFRGYKSFISSCSLRSGGALQETVKFTRAQITYDGPLVSYLTYDGPNSALVDYSNLRRPRLDLRRLSLNYEGPNATVVDYL